MFCKDLSFRFAFKNIQFDQKIRKNLLFWAEHIPVSKWQVHDLLVNMLLVLDVTLLSLRQDVLSSSKINVKTHS